MKFAMGRVLKLRKIKLLIDGDILVYRLAFACQVRNKEVEPLKNVLHLAKKTIKDMQARWETENIKIYLTSDDHSNFRFELAKTKPYKGNRDPKINPKAPAKPYYYETLRKYFIDKYNTEVIYNIEADDALGIHQMKHLDDPNLETIICSIDKDLDMIPGRHYNFVTDTDYHCTDPGTLRLYDDRKKLIGEGLAWFYAQMILGDSADNIPGLPKHGPVKVLEILGDCKTEDEMWKEVQRTYIEQLGEEFGVKSTYSRLYEVADLLWMHRKEGDCKSECLRNMALYYT